MTTNIRGETPMRIDPDVRKSLRLERMRGLPRPERTRAVDIQVRMTAVSAAAQLFQGTLPHHGGDMEEFLACAQDLEDWINRD